ncbi:hypothetical protein NMG60_11014300 [Bertholletia excelsa]
MAARRRIAVLSSHLRPVPSSSSERPISCVSPWRCASGRVGKEGNPESDCVFCKITRGESPSFKLYEDDVCLCILDTNPVSHGHSLIIPKSHFPSLQATPPAVVGAMCSKVPSISNAIVKATGCDSFNLLVNNGKAAGQVIYHTHLHIIPRKARDCLWASESLPRRPLKLDQETNLLADRIRKELLVLDSSEDNKAQGSALMMNQ